MSQRSWIAAVALGLNLICAVALAQEPDQSTLENQPIAKTGQDQSATAGDDNGTNQPPPTIDPTPALQRIESAIRDLIAEDDQIESKRKQDREIRDLSAQENMAEWARWMFWATTATVFLTFGGLVLIWRTLHHTRRAADFTKAMLKEAKETTVAAKGATDAAFQAVDKAGEANALTERTSEAAIELTRDIARHELRAYVAPDSMRHGERVGGEHIDYVLRLKNFGNTPANSVTMKVKTGIGAGTMDSANWGEFQTRPTVDLPPNQFSQVEIEVAGINASNILDIFDELVARRAKLYVNVIFSYVDIYRVKHTASFFASSWGETFKIGGIGIDHYITEVDEPAEIDRS